MKNYLKLTTLFILIFSLLAIDPISSLSKPGSFGGSRGGSFGSKSVKPSSSFGGSKQSPSMQKPSGSFGGTKQSPATNQPNSSFGGSKSSNVGSGSSFGGSRQSSAPSFSGRKMNNSSEYTSKYGTPRKTMRSNEVPGMQSNYVVNHYGGMGDGFMMGYIMGSTPWYWRTPFHPAYYYSTPHYVYNDDGTVGVYPPTFSFGSLLLVLIVGGSILFIVVILVKRRFNRKSEGFGGSFD